MFARRRRKSIKNVIIDTAMSKPDQVIDCHEYMAVWVKSRSKMIFLPGDYTGLDDDQVDDAIARRLKATR